MQVFWYTFLFFLFGGSAARGGPRPLLKYASRLLDPLLCLSIRLLLGFSVRGHVIQPSHFSSSFSSCRIQLYVQLFWNFSVLHSFYVNKPSYSLPFNEPDNIPPPLFIDSSSSFRRILLNSFSFTGPYISRSIFLSSIANSLSSSMVSVHDSEPCVTTGRTNVRYIRNWLLLDMRLLLNSCLFAFFRRMFRIKRFFVLICVLGDSFLLMSPTRNCAISVFRKSLLLICYVILVCSYFVVAAAAAADDDGGGDGVSSVSSCI